MICFSAALGPIHFVFEEFFVEKCEKQSSPLRRIGPNVLAMARSVIPERYFVVLKINKIGKACYYVL